MADSQSHSKRDIAAALKLPVRTVTFWTDFGLVIPDITPSQGKGIARLYSNKNMIEFAMIDVLSKELGVSLDQIQKIMMVLRSGSYELPQGINKEYETIKFHDFYENEDYGQTKELCYCECEVAIKGRASGVHFHRMHFFMVTLPENGKFNFSVRPNSTLLKVLLLGGVKAAALKRIGVDHDYISADWTPPF